jgi:hypothetical protein
MRTTVRLDDRLMKEVKRMAHETGRTLTAVIETSLRECLVRHRRPAARARVRLPTCAGDGLLPGVDLDDSSRLLDRMERFRAPP